MDVACVYGTAVHFSISGTVLKTTLRTTHVLLELFPPAIAVLHWFHNLLPQTLQFRTHQSQKEFDKRKQRRRQAASKTSSREGKLS